MQTYLDLFIRSHKKRFIRTGAYPGWNGNDIARLEASARGMMSAVMSAPEGGYRGNVDAPVEVLRLQY